jgi:alpha-L-fucosidase
MCRNPEKGETMKLAILSFTLAALLPMAAWAAETQSATPAPAANMTIAPGKFQPTETSLKQYQCPEWFRDAKLGIWSHWGPQAVPMMGDWYARHMYVQGHPQYKHHLETYGHPSKQGYKEIIALWKAEKWDPDRLMELYKKAGAKYFVSMA